MALPVFELHALALRASHSVEPSELHGIVCGLAAARPATFSLPELLDLVGADMLTDEASVHEFVTATLDGLFAQDMEFGLVIPDDEEGLSDRLAALATWAAGFLSGFGAGAGNAGLELKALPADVQEILRDFASISALDEAVDGDEQDEASFMEIYEYVRVAAVLALTLMHENADDASDEPPAELH